MAYCWKTDLNPRESHEEQHEHQELQSVNQSLFPSQASLGFDQLVEEIHNKIPFYQSEIEENSVFVPSSPNWDSKKHSLDETQQIALNEFNSKSSELSHHQVRKTAVIGFRPSVLPNPQDTNNESSWGNPIGKHGADDYRCNILAPSSTSLLKINSQKENILVPASTSLDKINLQKELENKNHTYHIGFKSSISSTQPPFSTDYMSEEENERNRTTNTVEPPLMVFKESFLPRMWERSWPKNAEVRVRMLT